MQKTEDFLTESLVDCLDNYSPSGIEFFCLENEKQKAMECFMECFSDIWHESFAEAAETYNWEYDEDMEEWMNDENPVPLKIFETEDGFYAAIDNLTISLEDAGYNGIDTIYSSLHTLEKQYPNISYRGYVGFLWLDANCNTPEQAVFHKGTVLYSPIYESIKKALQKAVLDKEFWYCLLSHPNEDEMEMNISVLCRYEEWFDTSYIECIHETVDRYPETKETAIAVIASLLESMNNKYKSEDNPIRQIEL